jgi:25S rRNA (uracil2634-N3)-methyltransferase
VQGKGITDQDRNILANQKLLVGFLRSVAGFLSPGPLPKVNISRKRKHTEDSDPDDFAEGDAGSADGDNKPQQHARGTVLITLRNVSPYTLWFVVFLFSTHDSNCAQGHPTSC